MEESKSKPELDHLLHCTYQEWQRTPTPDTLRKHEVIKEQIAAWKQTMRTKHLDMIYTNEARGNETHRWTLAHGPKHPNSYLLYNDSGTLIFPRDQADRYSSYTFWLQHLADEEPVEHLGKEFFSAKELGVSPALIGSYYQLQQVFVLKADTNQTDLDRLQALHEEIQAAFHKIDGQGSHSK